MCRRRWWYRLLNLPERNMYASRGAERQTLSRALQQAAPAVILCHFGPMALRMVPLARRAKIPLVAHFHGHDLSAGLRNRWYRWSLRRQIACFTGIVVVADYQRERLIKLGADPRKVHVIPCGVPVHEIVPATDVAQQPCQFLTVGRLVEKKGPLETLRAFALCARQVPGCTLTMVGDGPLAPGVRQLARELGIEDGVRLLGNQPSNVVLREMRKAGVFLQHSLTSSLGDMEGWPVAVAEAMATGLPVVATRHAGIEKQVIPGEVGFLVDEGDWRGMSNFMIQLAQSPAQREQMGRRARALAESSFCQRALVTQLESVLVGAAAKHPRISSAVVRLPTAMGRAS